MDLNNKINNIIDLLSGLSLLELNALIIAIREKFQIKDLHIDAPETKIIPSVTANEPVLTKVEKSTFDVILQVVPTEKRVAILKAIRNATSLDLKGAKDSISNLPKTLLENLPKEEAEETKIKLEEAGATVALV